LPVDGRGRRGSTLDRLYFWMHFVQPVWIILPFDLGTAFMLVGMAAICGFVIGTLFAFVRNRLHLN
jgi:hypothetical protein